MTIQEQLAAELKELAETTPSRGGTTRSGLLQASGYVRTWTETATEAPLGGDQTVDALLAVGGQEAPETALQGARIPDWGVFEAEERITVAEMDRLMVKEHSHDWIVGYLDETAGIWGNDVLAQIAKHLIDSGFATTEGGIFRAVERP